VVADIGEWDEKCMSTKKRTKLSVEGGSHAFIEIFDDQPLQFPG
jgi:hypothetical protein